MPFMTCGEAVTHLLARYGVQHVFGIPGVHSLELYRGLSGAGIAHISPRHEQGAVFMADGYARLSQRPGVCFLITGPGATNALTGMAQAYNDSIPLLIISAVNRRHELAMGDGALHELSDQSATMSGAAAFAHRLLDPANLESVIARAFALFSASRPRPVYIEIPVDVLQLPYDGPLAGPAAVAAPHPAPDVIGQAAEQLACAHRPLIIAGGGAIHAADALRSLVERCAAPVVLTTNARGLLPPDHPQLADNALTQPEATQLLQRADFLLAVGTELGPTDFPSDCLSLLRSLACARIDIDPSQMHRCREGDVALVGDAAAALTGIGDALTRSAQVATDPGWSAEVVHTMSRLSARGTRGDDLIIGRMLKALARHPSAPVVVGDSTAPVYQGFRHYRAPRPVSWFNSATGYGTLGYGLPAAIGARLAAPSRPVVALVGDGGLQFALAELASARELIEDLLVIVWNNAGYAEIEFAMTAAGIPSVGVNVQPPDFESIAQAMSIGYARAEDADNLESLLENETFRGVRLLEVRFGAASR